MGKNVLIITTAFSPENAIGSIRLTKFVKYLIRLNHQVTVISPALHEGSKIDYSLEADELKKCNRILIPQSKIFNRLFLSKRNKVIKSSSASHLIKTKKNKSIVTYMKTEFFRLVQYLYTLLRNSDWKRQVIRHLKSNYGKNEFDVVLSSYPSLGGPWAAIYAKKKNIARKFIVDFRDPVNYEKNSNFYKTFINTHIQNKIISKADKVTYISHGIAQKFGNVKGEKLMFLPNGFDPEDYKHPESGKKITHKLIMSYVGSLYGGERDLSIVFQAIKDLYEKGILDISKVEIIYAGHEFEVLKKQAKKYELEHVLVNKGFVTRSEAIDIQSNSDIVLISSWNTEKDQGILSGKIYECFLTRKTVLAVINGTKPDSELAAMIQQVNAGFSIEEACENFADDYKKLIEFLENAYREKTENHKLESRYNNRLEFYSYQNIVECLNKLIIEIT